MLNGAPRKGLLLGLILVFTQVQAQEEARLMRFPTISKEAIVFSYGGDLYRVDRNGGDAKRLTSHKGYEAFPRFSPSGEQIAFTANYDGNREVYTIPAEGGQPQRITYSANLSRDNIAGRMGPNNIVMGWKGKDSILYRSRWRAITPFKGDLKVVSAEGGMPRTLPLSSGGFADFSPDQEQLAFNRVFREFRTWKHYRGGMADDVRIMDRSNGEIRAITNSKAQDIIPMWHGDKVYFLSDRNWRMNLFSYDTETQEIKQETEFDTYDIKFPSIGPGAIVFAKGGYLYTFDLSTGETQKVKVNISNDQVGPGHKRVDASEFKGNHHLAPDGSRIAVTGRGDIFSLPIKEGITYNLTQSEGVHNRKVRWSPDGKHLAFISDKTKEDEVYVMDNDGSDVQQLTEGNEEYKYHLRWSPDSEKILFANKQNKLKYVEVSSGDVVEVDHSKQWEFSDYRWSPDSRWVVYSKAIQDEQQMIFAYDTEDGEAQAITDGWYSSYSPHFSKDGDYLYFTSNRTFDPIYSRTEWNHVYRDMTKVYLVPLEKGTPSPFKPENNRVSMDQEKDEQSNGKDSDEEVEVRIDFEGITDRIEALPVPASNYGGLRPVKNRLFFVERSFSDKKAQLKSYHFGKEKLMTHGPISGYQIAANDKKLLFRRGSKYFIQKVPKKGKLKPKERVKMEDMQVRVDLSEEYQQIFRESWRQMRDFFYAPNMHGFAWDSLRMKYAPLVDHVSHRADLTFVIGEMMASLNTGHAYVSGGDMPEVEQVKTGLLGARFSKHSSGYFRVDQVYEGANWSDAQRSPLQAVDVNVTKGDYILKVNGQSLAEVPNIYQMLVGQADEMVSLTVNSEPEMDDSRQVLVKPLKSEKSLYYHNWVQDNIDYVDSLTNGKVGYIHIPDMVQNGLNEFAEYFYPQLRKEALIVDIRANGGGNVSPMLIERLRREVVLHQIPRNGQPSPDPGDQLVGPKVCLMDQWTASDGDLFAYRFRAHELGPLIGHRTWGGVVGIRGSLPFVDGFSLNKPEFAKFDTEGEDWIIENKGVEPDIPVTNSAYQQYQGNDNQLDTAIEEAMDRLDQNNPEIPEAPPYPDKSEDGQ